MRGEAFIVSELTERFVGIIWEQGGESIWVPAGHKRGELVAIWPCSQGNVTMVLWSSRFRSKVQYSSELLQEADGTFKLDYFYRV